MTALSVASPYPWLIVGDGQEIREGTNKILKEKRDRDSAVEGCLNP